MQTLCKVKKNYVAVSLSWKISKQTGGYCYLNQHHQCFYEIFKPENEFQNTTGTFWLSKSYF
jgi:hypothetical protein